MEPDYLYLRITLNLVKMIARWYNFSELTAVTYLLGIGQAVRQRVLVP